MIISPVAFHRALFRQGRKPELVRFAHRMATGGLAFMLIAMVSAILLITDFLLNLDAGRSFSPRSPAAWFLTFWAALPFARRNWVTTMTTMTRSAPTRPPSRRRPPTAHAPPERHRSLRRP